MSINSISYTYKEGQYLAFIFYYTKINGIPPAQKDIERYFSVTPPTVHQMLIQLEKKEFIERIPRQPRAIKLCIPQEMLPKLD